MSRSTALRCRLSIAVLALFAALGSAGAADTLWEYRQIRDSDTGTFRHTLQTRLEYDQAIAALAFVCARRNLVLTVVASWPIAAVLRYRFATEPWQWIEGSSPVASTAVFQGPPVRELFAAVQAKKEVTIRLLGPKSMVEKTISLEDFEHKAAPLKQNCAL